MTTLSYTVPTAGSTLNSVADPELATALNTILTWANGNVDATNINSSTWAAAGVTTRLTRTVAAGVSLINGTQTILTWTAPSDSNLHVANIGLLLKVTSPETGGQINVVTTVGGVTLTIVQITQGQGSTITSNNTVLVDPGATVTVSQATALTAGASALYGVIQGI